MSDRAFIHRPFDGHIRMKPTGILMARLKNEVGLINVGDYESVSYSFEFEEDDIYSPQAPERVKIANLVTQSDVSLSFELSQLTPMFRTIAMQSDSTLVLNQVAEVGKTIAIDDAGAGRIFPTGFRRISNVEIVGAGPDDYVEGTHFQFDAETGYVEIIEHPGGTERGDVTISFDTAAITGRQVWGMLSQTDVRGALSFRSTNTYGPRQLVEFWDVKFRPDGDQTLGSNSTDWANVSFNGEVFADPTKSKAFAYGQVTDLPAAA